MEFDISFPLMFQGKYVEAESLHVRLLAIDEKVYGPGHPNVARDLNNWAGLLEGQVSGKIYSGFLAILVRCIRYWRLVDSL